ncbi:MAG: TonB-dependent receptor [Alistipes sp.]|nr:TonB-dependent receptor [Alistipes sp.]
MVRKLVLSLIAVLGVCAMAPAQSRQVSGSVTDPDGKPVVGASVIVDGTSNGTTTSSGGKFVIAAPEDATLTISFIGYRPRQVAVAGKTVLDITLTEDSQSIDDVVVVGYGSGRKVGTIIGSVDQVKGDKLEDRPSNNVMDALQGQVPGLQIFSSSGELTDASTIRLHGMGSISAGNEPLILLDGAPITTETLLAMSQGDIASINILKDASATSIYGSRAANGVIYVTSKKGSRGQDGATVTLRAQYSFSNAIKPRLKRMNTDQLLDYRAAVYAAANGMDYTDPDIVSRWRNTLVNNFGIDESVDVDWFDEIMKDNAPMYQIDFSVSGGSQRTSYYFSGSYLDQQGILPGSAVNRYTFRTNIDTKATDWLKAGMSLGVGYQKADNATTAASAGGLYTSNPMFASLLIPAYQPAVGEDGKPLRFLDQYGADNPAIADEWYYKNNNRLQLNGSAFIELIPVEGLGIRSQLSANAFDYRSKAVYSPDYPTATGPKGSGEMAEGFQRSYVWTWTNTAEYRFEVADQHHLSALLGHESIYGSGESMSIGVKGLTNPDLIFLNKGTEVSALPSYSLSQYAYNSVFGRVEYDFAEKYFVDGSVRYDACSRFGANNRGATFWSVGGMWNLKKEAFLADNDLVSDLSLKVSYGTQGNSGIGNYTQYETIVSSRYPYNGSASWVLSNAGNSSLAWEKQGTLTVGAHIELWKKLRLNVEWYRRQTTDMLMRKPLALSGGFSSQMSNIGGMRNSGVDINLNYDIFANKDWSVNFYANFNYNKNKMTKLWEPDLKQASMGDGSMMYYVVGKPFGEFYTQEWRGVNPETGEPQWTAADGGITTDFDEAAEVDLNKSVQAPYSGGFGLNVSWKGIGLIADFAWVAGNYMANNNIYFAANTYFAGTYGQVREALDYWKQPGDHTKYPALYYESQFDSRMIEDASFLRLKNIQLSYTLPSQLLRKTRFIKGLKVYIGARNLLTVTGYNGFDPEVAGGDLSGDIGAFDTDVYPNSRQWTFGCEFTF